MSLSEAIATQAAWIQIWVGWIAVINIATLAALLITPALRRDGIVVGVAVHDNFLLMKWLNGQFGYVRLLGLSHVLIWTPLALYLILALRSERIVGWVRRLTQVFVLSMGVSLIFDTVDVARWIMGEQGSMLPAAPSDGSCPDRWPKPRARWPRPQTCVPAAPLRPQATPKTGQAPSPSA